MQLRTIVCLAALAACRPARAQPEAQAQLVGRAYFTVALYVGGYAGNVRFILRGIGDISDDCPDAADRAFVAEYDGSFLLGDDGSFEAPLYPYQPTVTTPSGCPISRVVIERIDTVIILASVPALHLTGAGTLDFQTMTSVDNDELQNGSFGNLHATLVLEPVQP